MSIEKPKSQRLVFEEKRKRLAFEGKLNGVKSWAADSLAFYIIAWIQLEGQVGVKKSAALLNLLGADLTKQVVTRLNSHTRAKIVSVIFDLSETEEEREAILDELIAKGSCNELLAAKVGCQQMVLRQEMGQA